MKNDRRHRLAGGRRRGGGGRRAGTARRRLVAAVVAAVLTALELLALGLLAPGVAKAEPGPPIADEFSSGALNTDLWTVTDPLGDSTVAVADGALGITIPAGTAHDLWTGPRNAVRVTQQVANVDFEVEVGFTSAVSLKYQLQGLVVVGADGSLVRFDTHSNGSSQRMFAAVLSAGGSASTMLNSSIPATTPIAMRLARIGSDWTFAWSPDGVSWNLAVTFTHAVEMTSLGVFAGTAGSSPPAMAGLVDYFRPVTSDSTPPVLSAVAAAPAADSATVTWTTDEPASSLVEFGTTSGYGQSAGQTALTTTHEVLLTGLSCETGYHYRVVSADAAGNTATGGDLTFTTGTCPPPDSTPPTISSVSVQPTVDGAVVTWTTDEPATSTVEYGPTADYGQIVTENGTTTDHAVTVPGLTCDTMNHFRVVSADGSGNVAASPDGTFTTAGCQAGVQSDEFAGDTLNTAVWSLLVDPVGDATVSVADGRLALGVPAGTSHDFWTAVASPRLLQAAPNADIEVQAKFDSPVSEKYQLQGLVAQDGVDRFIRFDTYSTGSAQKLFAATFAGGGSTTRLNTTIPTTVPIVLKMARVGDTWTLEWSTDGTNFTLATTFSFTMQMSGIGVFVGNKGNPAPTMTALVDYFRVGGAATSPAPLTISGVSAAASTDSAVVAWTTDRAASSAVDYGPTADYGQTVQDPAEVTSHSVPVTGLACGTTYHYRVTSSAADGATASSPDGELTTATCSAPTGPFSDDFSGSTLDPEIWAMTDPLGDATLTSTGTNAVLFVPSGTTHDMWTGSKTGARLMQDSPDADFEIETKFSGAVELSRQTRGLVIEQDGSTLLRFDESFSGTSHRLFAATISGSSASTKLNATIAAGTDLYLRIRRQGDDWTLRYSRDGASWQTVASFTFGMTVAAVGPYVGNGQGPAAFASVDYFSNLADPVVNDDGGAPTATSAPPAIDVWYAQNDAIEVGARSLGQQWVDVAGTVSDADGVGQLWYSLNGSANRLLDMGPTTRRLVDPGDFVAELDRAELVTGPNQVVLSSFDRRGDQASRTITVNYLAGPTPPLPDTVDWTGVSAIHDVAQVVDGRWTISDGKVRTTQIGYDRLISVGSTDWPDGYQVTAQVTIHSTSSSGVGVLTGWTGHTGTSQPRSGHPYGALGWYRIGRLELVDTNAIAVVTQSKSLTPEVEYTFVFRAEPQGDGNSIYSFKVFETGTPEPPTWDLTTTLPSRAGSVLLVAHHTDASFGTVTTAPLESGP